MNTLLGHNTFSASSVGSTHKRFNHFACWAFFSGLFIPIGTLLAFELFLCLVQQVTPVSHTSKCFTSNKLPNIIPESHSRGFLTSSTFYPRALRSPVCLHQEVLVALFVGLFLCVQESRPTLQPKCIQCQQLIRRRLSERAPRLD